jgi:hypothetical protein
VFILGYRFPYACLYYIPWAERGHRGAGLAPVKKVVRTARAINAEILKNPFFIELPHDLLKGYFRNLNRYEELPVNGLYMLMPLCRISKTWEYFGLPTKICQLFSQERRRRGFRTSPTPNDVNSELASWRRLGQIFRRWRWRIGSPDANFSQA